MSWSADDSDDRVVAVRAQSKVARGQLTTWPYATVLVFWGNALAEVQAVLVHACTSAVVTVWGTESTCPASVERLVNEGAALLINVDGAAGGEFEGKAERQLDKWREKLKRYADGTLVLLDDSAAALNETSPGYQVADDQRDEWDDDGIVDFTDEGYQPPY